MTRQPSGPRLGWDGGGGDEFYGGVVEDLVEAAGRVSRRGISRGKRTDLCGIGVVDPLELAAGLEEAVGLAEDMAVIEVGGGKGNSPRPDHRASGMPWGA